MSDHDLTVIFMNGFFVCVCKNIFKIVIQMKECPFMQNRIESVMEMMS